MKATPSPPSQRAPLRPRELFGALGASTAREDSNASGNGGGAKAGSGAGAPPRQRRGTNHHHLHAHASVWSAAAAAPTTSQRRRPSGARALLALAALLTLTTAAIALAWRSAGESALAAAARPGVLLARPASVRVLDGDTLDVARVRIRLLHMDAPEGEQSCGSGSVWQRARWPPTKGPGKGRWACGDAATAALARLVAAASWVECTPGGRDVYGRTLAACDAVGPGGPAWWWASGGFQARASLASWMVERGWAVAYGAPRATGLKALETAAKARGVGVWTDDRFERPEAWRKRAKQQQQKKKAGGGRGGK